MTDPDGFLRYHREAPRKERVLRRLRHWREYVGLMPEAQARRQADRCMDCGTPYCHARCPVHNLIPEWNALVYERQWRSAYDQLDSTNNFPELTGRLCPAPCEHACTLRISDAPVSIKDIELAVSEHAWEAGWVRPMCGLPEPRGHVAVVGSGPAGLACAQQMCRAGYAIEVLEKADRIGGLLRYGIPDFRLDKRILDRRLTQMRSEGVVFRASTPVGDLRELGGSWDAVVLACGCEVPREVVVPGRSLRGIHLAMEYLEQQNRRIAGLPLDPVASIDAKGLDVVVVGGGDTGGDCVGTSVRQGADNVTQVQYHEQPPEHGDVLAHWPEPAPELRPDDHDEEGCRRIWGWDTIAFDGGGDRVEAVILQRLEWRADGPNRWRKALVQGAIRRLPAQLVLIAIGYAHPQHGGLVRAHNLALTPRGMVAAGDTDYRSNAPGVFICGDMRRGQSLVVWAIREGRQCARAVDRWLAQDSVLPLV